MNAPALINGASPSDLHLRLIASAVLNGQFDGLPLNVFSKVDWVDAAQQLADVEGEPEDEAQALAEIELMFARSAHAEREEADAYAYETRTRRNYDDDVLNGLISLRTERTMEVMNLMCGDFAERIAKGGR